MFTLNRWASAQNAKYGNTSLEFEKTTQHFFTPQLEQLAQWFE